MKNNPEEILLNIQRASFIDENPSLSDSTLEIIVENTIQILSICINNEFNHNSGTKSENLFYLPDMLGFDLTSKVQLTRDLSELLYNCKSKRTTMMPSQSIESLRNYRPNSANLSKDLLRTIMTTGHDGLFVSSSDAEQILNIISSFSATSDTNKYRVPLANTQKEFILLSQKIEQMKKTLRTKQDEHDFLEISNKKLADTIELLKKQENYLEKKLEDSMVEYFSYEEHKKTLIQELQETNLALTGLLKEKTSKIETIANNPEIISDEENEEINTKSLNPFRPSGITK
jgi:hypothetical protein